MKVISPALRSLLIAIILAACVLALLSVSESGIRLLETRDVKIGMKRSEVIAALIKSGVEDAIPIVATPLVVRDRNIDHIEELLTNSGICVSNNSGVSLNLQVHRDGTVTKLYETERHLPELTNVKVVGDIKRGLESSLRRDKNLLAGNCIPNVRWISLASESESLGSYSAWRYRDPDSHASVDLVFSGDVLRKIRYRWNLGDL